MPFYYYFIVFLMLLLFLLLIRFYIRRKMDFSVELFSVALKNENSGDFEEAIVNYENALLEVKKSRFFNNSLEARIIEKLKVLHTAIDYKRSFHLVK